MGRTPGVHNQAYIKEFYNKLQVYFTNDDDLPNGRLTWPYRAT